MVRVDAHAVVLQVEGILAEFDVFEFVFVEVRPAPQPRVNHMRETLPARHLRGEEGWLGARPTGVERGGEFRVKNNGGGAVHECQATVKKPRGL